jgi:hypothetical protein
VKIEIQDGVPIPDKRHVTIYPFRDIEVGQSFLLPAGYQHSSIYYQNKRLYPKKFTARRLDDGCIRVWRIL